jgi:hypothetical protein
MMNASVAETTWGTKLISDSLVDWFKSENVGTSLIKSELHAFLGEEIREWEPEIVIVVERRGTAILRALKEEFADFSSNVPWENVISSRVLDQLPPNYFSDKRILIFDDLKRRGSQVNKVLTALSKLDPSNNLRKNVRVAVFAMHEDASSDQAFPDFGVTHYWRYRGLTDSAYRNKRLEIIAMLQTCGSLMLDTEHIEVRMRLKGTFPQLLEALARKATVIPFHSLGYRQNITILYEDDDPAHVLPMSRLPPGTETDGIVRKCRIVERGNDEFAIIPICYPIVHDSDCLWPKGKFDAELLGRSASIRKSRSRFYGAALFSSLAVLEWTLKSVYAAGDRLADIWLPTGNLKQTSRAYNLRHLHVMYPTLDLEKLNLEIAKVASRAEHEGRQVHRRVVEITPPIEISDLELRKNAWALLQVIRRELDNIIQEERLMDPNWEPPYPFGLTPNQVFALGARFNWPKVETSALFDVLIDDGYLVTEVASNVNRSKQRRDFRVFLPGDEMVSELVRLYTSQRGLPDGF